MVSLIGFLVVAWIARAGVLQAWERSSLTWVYANRALWLDLLALMGAGLGSRLASTVILGLAAFWFVRTRRYACAVALVSTIISVPVLISILKVFYGRPRPTLGGDEIRALGLSFTFPSSAAFPSGHALIAAGAFGTLTILLLRHVQIPALRRAVAIGSGVGILLICWSRIYLAVHYPTDVIAGLLMGLVWLAACLGVLEVWVRRGHRAAGIVTNSASEGT